MATDEREFIGQLYQRLHKLAEYNVVARMAKAASFRKLLLVTWWTMFGDFLLYS